MYFPIMTKKTQNIKPTNSNPVIQYFAPVLTSLSDWVRYFLVHQNSLSIILDVQTLAVSSHSDYIYFWREGKGCQTLCKLDLKYIGKYSVLTYDLIEI